MNHLMGIDVGNSRKPIMPGGIFKREDREELRIQLENLGKIPKNEVDFEVIEGKITKTNYPRVPKTPKIIKDFTIKIGEGFAGPPFFEVAHIDLMIGKKGESKFGIGSSTCFCFITCQ